MTSVSRSKRGRQGKPCRTAGVVAGIFLAVAACAGAAPAAELASAPVDRSLFRDGEVTNTDTVHGRWSVACEEVTRLHLRYCSLRTVVLDDRGSTAARLTVSTGDDGKPAALVDLPLGVRISSGVSIELGGGLAPPVRKRQAGSAGPGQHVLQIVECDRRACYAVWNLRAEELQLLNAGAAMYLAYKKGLASIR